jgi:putative acetyltransferase
MREDRLAPKGVTFRTAGSDDIEFICDLFARSRAAAMPYLPVLHTPQEDRAFFSSYFQSGTVTLAVQQAVAGFMVETPGWIEHLYLDPAQRGQGIGQSLVQLAMRRQEQLHLWCFARNSAARRFYERLGFVQVGGTEGDNEEGLPDILYAWRRPSSAVPD